MKNVSKFAKVLTVYNYAQGLALLPCTDGIGCSTRVTRFISPLDLFEG